jgi:hypothetical protein
MIKQPLTEQQLFSLFSRLAQPVQMPPDVSKRIRHRVLTEARKLRKLHQLHRRSQLRRRVAGVVVALVLVMMAAGSVSAGHTHAIYLPLIQTPPVVSAAPPQYDYPPRAYLPVAAFSEAVR